MASRGGFSSKIGFILAAAGSAVGLGNIWKFPFEVGEGGGAAFVFVYLIFCFILCFPVMITEIAMGRKTSKNPVGAFNSLGYKKWNFIGKIGIISGFLILSFYNVVAGWAFGYFLEMLSGNFDIGNQFGDYIKDVYKVGGYAIVFMLTTAFIVSKGVSGGIEKASKILMPTLLIMIIGLVIYSLTLPHALEGLSFYLVPDFSKLTTKVIGSAMGQAFFSLSLGMGALITYGSYVGKKDNIVSSAAFITLTDVGIAVIAGMMMFPLVAYLTDGTMEGAGQGAGLIFAVLPGAFETLGPVLGVVIGSAFFLLLSFAALTSTVSLLEVPVAYTVDELNMKRGKAVWLVAGVIFLIGLPSLVGNGYSEFFSNFITYFGAENPTDFMTFIGHVANDTFLPLGGCLIVIFAAYVWKKENLSDEISNGFDGYKGSFLEKYINFAITVFCPIVLGIMFITTVLSKFFNINLGELLF
ncbi:sodium-dependent transporter [Marivirga atlantica]|jgi:NSS family neurotransmitter:Na+ symporter|uniref:Sodium-dependent transporter n=1 Tax=Marivirga atlantica TaxID=1548457 RepID=A0A937AEX4_9BACT|nr:sodium-dependent transporter [Marivirga atlantica]MBL0765451.1 sodium-dependent transporter [Marivirga atlantica]